MKYLFKPVSLSTLGLCALLACQAPTLNQPVQTQTQSDSQANLTGIKPWELIVEIKNNRLESQVKADFGAEVLDRFDLGSRQYLLFRLNPEKTKSQLNQLTQLTQLSLNKAPDDTRAAAQAIKSLYPELIQSIEFNVIAELPQVTAPLVFNDLLFGLTPGLEGWWRTETQVESAWHYSIGTGVTAGYIDQGFVRQHPELERRLIINGQNNQTSEYLAKAPSDITLPPGDHGTASMLVGFAERGNRLPSAGVAPNAKVAPYVAETVWDVSRALYTAYRNQPDVIGINFAFPLYPRWQAYSEYRQYQLLKDVFSEIARNNQIPVVVPAHNYGEPVTGGPRDWVPVAWANEYQNVIGVGGIQAQKLDKELKLQAWFSPDLLTGINARGSNYGEGLIWAPSTGLDIANTRPNGLTPGSMNGTSAGCPFITAALTVIRSRAPELKPVQLREILLRTARRIPADQLLQKAGATVPMIQLESAIKAALTEAGKNPESFRAKRFSGRLSFNGKNHVLETANNRFELLPSLAELDGPNPSALTGQQVNVMGWSQLPGQPANTLEVLSLSAD